MTRKLYPIVAAHLFQSAPSIPHNPLYNEIGVSVNIIPRLIFYLLLCFLFLLWFFVLLSSPSNFLYQILLLLFRFYFLNHKIWLDQATIYMLMVVCGYVASSRNYRLVSVAPIVLRSGDVKTPTKKVICGWRGCRIGILALWNC